MSVIFLAVSVICLSIVDIVLTNRIISDGGKELNPIIRCLMEKLGSSWWIPKLVVTVLVVLFLVWIGHWIPLLVVFSIMSGIVIWNIKELRRK